MLSCEKKQYQTFCVKIYSDIDCDRAIREFNENGRGNFLENTLWPNIYWVGPRDGVYAFLGPCGYAMIADYSGTGRIAAETEKEAFAELIDLRNTVGFLALDNVLHTPDDLEEIKVNGIILRPNKGDRIRQPLNFGAVLWTGNDAIALKETDAWIGRHVVRVDEFSDIEVTYALTGIFMHILARQVADKSLESHDWTYKAMLSFHSSVGDLLASSQFHNLPSNGSSTAIAEIQRLLEQARSNAAKNMEVREREQGQNNARLDYLLAVLAGAAMISTVLDITEYGFTHWDELLSGHWSPWMGGSVVSLAVLIGVAWVVWSTMNKNK